MIMGKFNSLISVLRDGKDKSLHAYEIESSLNMDVGHTQEPTREVIREAIVDQKIPVGSTPQVGYFLINTEAELDEVVKNLEKRIEGLKKRIDGLRDGWQRRVNSRADGGNWPK